MPTYVTPQIFHDFRWRQQLLLSHKILPQVCSILIPLFFTFRAPTGHAYLACHKHVLPQTMKLYPQDTNTYTCTNTIWTGHTSNKGRRLSKVGPSGQILIKASEAAITIWASLLGLEAGLTAPVAHGIEVFTGDSCEDMGQSYFLANNISENPWTRVAYEHVSADGPYQLVKQQYYDPIEVRSLKHVDLYYKSRQRYAEHRPVSECNTTSWTNFESFLFLLSRYPVSRSIISNINVYLTFLALFSTHHSWHTQPNHWLVTLIYCGSLQRKYNAVREITITAGQLGLSTLDIEGRVVIVRDSHGRRVGCGVLLRPNQNLLASIGDINVSMMGLSASAWQCTFMCQRLKYLSAQKTPNNYHPSAHLNKPRHLTIRVLPQLWTIFCAGLSRGLREWLCWGERDPEQIWNTGLHYSVQERLHYAGSSVGIKNIYPSLKPLFLC